MEGTATSPPQPLRDLVVIGASAGGVEALRTIVAGLPADLPAALCVVLHIAPTTPSALPQILARAGRLPCRSAVDGEPLKPGEILVAPPDHHLVIEDGRVGLSIGPRENGLRPSVDTLFRSAAYARGSRVIGVILSGTRDDGTLGMAVIQARGGATLVQDPEEALYAGMPASTLAHVAVDVVAPSSRLAQLITAMVHDDPAPMPAPDVSDPPESSDLRLTTICPACGGVLSHRTLAGMPLWQCRVGHRYSPESLVEAQAADVEAAMWGAVRALEDRQLLLEKLIEQATARGPQRSIDSFLRRATEAGRQAQLVRDALVQAAGGSLRELEAAEAAELRLPGEESR